MLVNSQLIVHTPPSRITPFSHYYFPRLQRVHGTEFRGVGLILGYSQSLPHGIAVRYVTKTALLCASVSIPVVKWEDSLLHGVLGRPMRRAQSGLGSAEANPVLPASFPGTGFPWGPAAPLPSSGAALGQSTRI